MVSTNGLAGKRVRLCFNIVRGSPLGDDLWECYKGERLTREEFGRLIGWMISQANPLWQKIAEGRREFDERAEQDFLRALQTHHLWIAVQQQQITIKELMEALCHQARQALTPEEEDALLGILLQELLKG
ncbi:hypothetical protein KJ840_04765 [Patescibacteria group bacterium]|nr:hypothetical protein [Patescibacteria group bacterium]